MADTNERKHDRIVIAETLEAIVALQFDTNAKYLRTLADAATELREADAELAATPPAGSALADSIDSLGFVISGDNPPVKEWVSECGGGCMPATKEEKMMWDVLQSALRARAVPDGFVAAHVKNLDVLVASIDRAESKGYLPDAIADAWAGFDYRLLAASKEVGK